jgi:prepilin-type N-terminal cleavage/methylation domain-containing protein
MKSHSYTPPMRSQGFSLVEMAVVLVILGLLIGGLVLPLSGQLDAKRYSETRQELENIKSALIGFAVLYGRLPCPSVIIDPTDVNYGVEITPCTALTSEGYLPWKTLGMSETDAWNGSRIDATSPGLWRYRVNSNFSSATTLFTINTVPNTGENLIVRNTAGTNLTTTTENPVAVVFSAGKNLVVEGENAVFESTNGIYQSDLPSTVFDDQLIWIGRPMLISRMIAAGKLP